MATDSDSWWADASGCRWASLLIVFIGLSGGCGASSGHDPGLVIGGRAKLISVNGSDVALEVNRPAAARAGRGNKSSSTVKIETLSVLAGTEVIVLAVDGEDARIRLEGSPHTGLITWVESAKLEPVRP